jgi:hypothetical protein
VKRYNSQLRDLIIRGRATPSLIVSHELPLDQAPDAYDQFDKRVDGWTGKCCGCCSPPSGSSLFSVGYSVWMACMGLLSVMTCRRVWGW